MKIALDDLWPKKIEGGAQIPFLYAPDHNRLLNEIIQDATRKIAEGRVIYEVEP